MAESKPKQPWMVNLSTFVAVCGSLAFGSCPGYSSPAQAAIRNDLFLTIAEFSLFGSLLTFGAMIGAITSGPIPDLVGRKGAGAKAYIFAGGATAEHLAADIGDLVLINCLLKLDEGNRPLEVAALRENKKIVETPPIDNKV
uniref:Major facilitator superfamily (MFS) profile domain-containing protein n=1 Tax=Brassica campestris TaxID=3711 RepID=M4DDQ8_BRACM